jgi:hypothetical protein
VCAILKPIELPAPDASDDLIHCLDQAGQSAENWLGISAALLKREQERSDIQAGWLMTAFDYHLARRVGEERTRSDPFGEAMSADSWTYPTPIADVPKEVIALWASTADRVHAAATRARLHHLLFERGHGNKGTHGREAAAAYLALGIGRWSRLERAKCLHWTVDLSKRIGDPQEAAKGYPALVALATESLDQDKPEPGVALHALEVLAFEDSNNPELPPLLERAREVYGDDPWNTGHTIRIQEQVLKSDQTKREQLRRETVEAYRKHADKFPPGLARMAFLEDAARLADQYGLADLAEDATAAMQEMSIDELDLKTFSASASIPTEIIDAHVAGLVERDSLARALEGLAESEPPTGNIDANLRNTQLLAEQTPLASLFPTKHIGADGLARYTASSDAERLDEQLARGEIVCLSLGGELTARVLEGALERFSPSEEDIVAVLHARPHVSVPVARSLARAVLSFHAGRYEEATTVAMPRIESLVRALCQAKGVLRFRVQRDQRQGPSTRGQYPQLGSLLVEIKPWMDRSWDRFLWTFLVSPFGPNYRNELLHGYVDDATRTPAALTILAALRLALVPLSADRVTEDVAPGEDADTSSRR